MTPQEANPYRQTLQTMRASLLERISAQRGGVQSRSEAAADHFGRRQDSTAQLATERELEFAIGEREIDELVMIDKALTRIDEGRYGDCTDCGISVPAPRLQASPEAPRCIGCQEKAEQRHTS